MKYALAIILLAGGCQTAPSPEVAEWYAGVVKAETFRLQMGGNL